MKITAFNPRILTKDAEPIVRLFEELGFERHHTPTGTSATGTNYVGYRMKHPDGFYVDVAQSDKVRTQDEPGIRMNVDDYDAAYKILTGHGFKSATNNTTTDTGSAKADLVVSPSGFRIALIQHIKK